MKKAGVWIFCCIMLFFSDVSFAKIKVLSAENMYGDIIASLGGDEVKVVSVLQYPDQDPHLFSASPKLARELSDADFIVGNGLGYDVWMDQLVKSSGQEKKYWVVGKIMGRRLGDNPHLWYDPAMLPIFSKIMAEKLCQKSPANCAHIKMNLKQLLAWHQHWLQQIQNIKNQSHQNAVLASEPVMELLTQAMGFRMQGRALQLAMMNDAAPSPQAIREAMDLLNHHAVGIFFYNTQVQNPFTQSLKQLALQNQIAVVGVSETMPVGMHYQTWMQDVVDQIKRKMNVSSH